jgi:oligosaccharyltransferase complex subunit beta
VRTIYSKLSHSITPCITRGVKSGNEQFARDVAAWAFQESLVLRIDNTTHHLVNEVTPREQYTTNDIIVRFGVVHSIPSTQCIFQVYTVNISRYNPKTSSWEPYSGINDLQLEFTMLDPHIRTALLPITGSPGQYSVTFRAPDRHGVFKFIVDYKRRGFVNLILLVFHSTHTQSLLSWTHLHSSTTVSVAPPRHDGYPRFLSAAWPYYAGAISTSVGFLLFSALWLTGESREHKKGKGAKYD